MLRVLLRDLPPREHLHALLPHELVELFALVEHGRERVQRRDGARGLHALGPCRAAGVFEGSVTKWGTYFFGEDWANISWWLWYLWLVSFGTLLLAVWACAADRLCTPITAVCVACRHGLAAASWLCGCCCGCCAKRQPEGAASLPPLTEATAPTVLSWMGAGVGKPPHCKGPGARPPSVLLILYRQLGVSYLSLLPDHPRSHQRTIHGCW